jgi:hypothetical protein
MFEVDKEEGAVVVGVDNLQYNHVPHVPCDSPPLDMNYVGTSQVIGVNDICQLPLILFMWRLTSNKHFPIETCPD